MSEHGTHGLYQHRPKPVEAACYDSDKAHRLPADFLVALCTCEATWTEAGEQYHGRHLHVDPSDRGAGTFGYVAFLHDGDWMVRDLTSACGFVVYRADVFHAIFEPVAGTELERLRAENQRLRQGYEALKIAIGQVATVVQAIEVAP